MVEIGLEKTSNILVNLVEENKILINKNDELQSQTLYQLKTNDINFDNFSSNNNTEINNESLDKTSDNLNNSSKILNNYF